MLPPWKQNRRLCENYGSLYKYSEEELEGDASTEDYSALEHLDARAEAGLVAAIILAAANHARHGL